MKLSLNTNIGSIIAQNQLLKANEKLQTSFERLSSGLRINRASDDPAGLAMANSLQTDSRLMAQAVRNVNDGISVLSIAEGALRELSTILARQAELAQQSANGVYSLEQRQAAQQEAHALTAEYNRIVDTTTFNGRSLFDPHENALSIALGAGGDNQVSFALADNLSRISGTGALQAGVNYSTGGQPVAMEHGDFNEDGIIDLVTGSVVDKGIYVLIGNGDGTFSSTPTFYAGNSPYTAEVADLNNDGHADFITTLNGDLRIVSFLGNGDGTFSSYGSYAIGTSIQSTLADFNNDGNIDVATVDLAGEGIVFLFGNGDGSFGGQKTIAVGDVHYHSRVAAGDFNQDGLLDFAINEQIDDTLAIYHGTGGGNFTKTQSFTDGATSNPCSPLVADFNSDGRLDLAYVAHEGSMQMYVRYGQSEGTFGDSTQYAGPDHMSELAAGDINTDGITDLVTGATDSSDVVYVWLGNVDGTFNGTISYATGDDPNSLTIADFNGDGVDDIASANKLSNNYTVFLAETTRSAHTEYLTLTTVDGAKEALETISAAQQRVSAELGNIGAVQSRLSHTVSHLQVMRENYAAANSKIVDADIAEEVAQMVRQQILQQAITAVMAQANQQPALVLQLLK